VETIANKIALVTGGSRGIGKSICFKLKAAGYNVVAADISEDQLFSSGKLKDNNITFIKCDITKSEEVKELYGTIIKSGKLHLLVNNAGIIRDNYITKMPEEDFDAVLAVNLKGTWLMCKHAAEIMKDQKFGRIVNITSRAWLGNKGQSNYAASKAGVISLTRVLALELGPFNVCVNAVAPGLIETPLTKNLNPEVLQSLINAQPGKNIGKPEDVANAVLFLGADETHFINGQVLYVDGGKSIGSNMI
jgi:NAD(P)-dependent dehydrogenase (short-subunit alcohol dehydrogenase family)